MQIFGFERDGVCKEKDQNKQGGKRMTLKLELRKSAKTEGEF